MKSRKALTIIELIVLLAVFGVLAAALLPVLFTARGNARQILCAHNLHQIQTGMHMYLVTHHSLPIDTIESGSVQLGDHQTSHLWSGAHRSRRGLGRMIPEFVEEPRVFFEVEANWAKMQGPQGWRDSDGDLNWEDPDRNVMSSYVYRQNFGKRVSIEESGATYALVTEYTHLDERRFNHGGRGGHILFSDGHSAWISFDDSDYNLLKFDWFSLAAIDGAGLSGWETWLDQLADR